MSTQVSFNRLRFKKAIARAAAVHQPVASKRVSFACPACGATNRITVEQIAQQAKVVCPACKAPISLVDVEGGFGRVLKGE
jgi:peptide subunit release factor 1 (eRF1)